MFVQSIQIRNWKSYADSGRIDLGRVNIITGRNNSGKSAFLAALHTLQRGSGATLEENRLGRTGKAEVEVRFAEIGDDRRLHPKFAEALSSDDGKLTFEISGDAVSGSAVTWIGKSGETGRLTGLPQFSAVEPNNFIYPYLARRKGMVIDRTIDRQKTISVDSGLQNIASKVLRLADTGYVGHGEYVALCKEVLGFVPSTYAAEHGHRVGIPIGAHDHIPIDAMGEGVPSLLGLIVNICMANGHLFLVEEPENDVHPEALKVLLNAMVAKASENQFVVTTHSNIVLRHLGAAPDARVFSTELDYSPNVVPTSKITPVENSPAARINVLRKLGYDLYDFELNDGWLILEESSAQVIIRNYLIPWFCPSLARIQILASRGVDSVEPTFEDFRRLFLYAHLEAQYTGRAWVVVDGDYKGLSLVEKLRRTYSTWPAGNFRAWSEENFESYYPQRFSVEVVAALSLNHKEKRAAKKALLDRVKQWCEDDPGQAQSEFATSAGEVVAFLREVEEDLFGRR